jgi:hypothetical protein
MQSLDKPGSFPVRAKFFKQIIMQIDVVKYLNGNLVECNLYTGDRCIKIAMGRQDYEALVRDRFFICSGKEADSAGVLNTTHEFRKIKYIEGHVELL